MKQSGKPTLFQIQNLNSKKYSLRLEISENLHELCTLFWAKASNTNVIAINKISSNR